VIQAGLTRRHTWRVDQTSITIQGSIDTFLLLLIGIGPKLALIPFLKITASLDSATKRRVQRTMMVTAATVALLLVVFGELLRALLHFSIGSLSVAGGVILLVLSVRMVLSQGGGEDATAGKDPMGLARFPLAVPYLLNPVGIVGLMTISAEAKSVSVVALAIGILAVVLLIDVAVFRWGSQVSAKLDENRMLVTEKVFGFLIAAIAVQLILDGLASAGVIAPIRH
jgi:small neutral amino acid transporter SnatA (MarC family)